jgi:hypothetical protein
MWLRDSLPQSAAGVQVFLYGYDAEFRDVDGPTSVESIAISLISGLRGIGQSSLSAKPVVFLAHSLGGLVLKQCLIELANAGQSEMFMLQRVKACVFLAVPNRLPGPGELAAMVSSERFGGLLRELQAARNVGYISSMSGMLAGVAQANQIRLCSGYETMETAITKPTHHSTAGGTQRSARILDKEESIQDGSQHWDQFPIAKDHRNAIRLQSGSQTIETIVEYVREAAESVSAPSAGLKGASEGPARWPSLFSTSWTGIASYFKPSTKGLLTT